MEDGRKMNRSRNPSWHVAFPPFRTCYHASYSCLIAYSYGGKDVMEEESFRKPLSDGERYK